MLENEKKDNNKNSNDSPKLITSIYKINDEIKTETELIKKIKYKLKSKNGIKCKNINKNGFKGLFFAYETEPSWMNWIGELLTEEKSKKTDSAYEKEDLNLDKNNNIKKNKTMKINIKKTLISKMMT